MTPKAILFDLDDTLFDHRYSSRCGLAAVQKAQPGFALKSIDAFERDYMHLLDSVWPQVLAGTITADQSRLERFRILAQNYTVTTTEADLLHYATLYRDTYQESRQVTPGTVALLNHLRGLGIKIGIVTNNLLVEQQGKLQFCNLDHLIDTLVVSEEAGAIKPDPRIFEIALARVGCRADETVMVGDSWKHDVIGANGVGIRAVWYNRLGQARYDASKAAEIQSFEPLAEILPILLEDR
jgi:putative hydrolase of the HAD superfamily